MILTSNRTRELHEALRRRCVYHWIDYPEPALEAEIVMMRASTVARDTLRPASCARVGALRAEPLAKPPGVAETVEWAQGRHAPPRGRRALAARLRPRAIGVALKDQDDIAYVGPRLEALLAEAAS